MASGLFVVSAPYPAPPASASPRSTVAPGSARAVSSPGIALHVPRDGRLAGDGFLLTVVGYRFAYEVGYGTSAKYAAPGQALLVIGVTLAGSGTNVSLEVDGQAEALPVLNLSGPGSPGYWLVSVPADAKDVALQASLDGFSQAFSFTKGAREGPAPTVLYRAQGSWQLVDDITRGLTEVATPDPVAFDQLPGAYVSVDITSAKLTYFLPGTAEAPPRPSEAWLVISGTAMPSGPNGYGLVLDYDQTLPGAAFTLTLPKQKPLPAEVGGKGGPADESSSGGLFAGYYYWAVPATMTTAVVQLHMPAELLAQPVYDDGLGAASNTSEHEVPVRGAVPPVDVAFAPGSYTPPAPSSPGPAAWAPKLVSARTSAGPSGDKVAAPALQAKGPGGPGALLWVLVVALLGVLAASVVFGRRRLVALFATITATPAEKRAAAVRAFLPSPAGPAPEAPTSAAAEGPPPPSTQEEEREAAPATAAPEHVLLPVPEGPVPLPEGSVEVQLLGSPQLAGDLPMGADELTGSQLETLAALALFEGKPISGERLRAYLSVGRREEWSTGTVQTYVNALRRVLGPDRVPQASGGAGFRAVGIGTDIGRFRRLVAQAKAEPENAPEHLAGALSLLRGEPLSGVPEGSYGWADRRDLGDLRSEVATLAHSASATLARLAVSSGDHELATWAVAKGLMLSGTEEDLNKLALDAAALNPDRSALHRCWAAIERTFAVEYDPVPESLVEYYEALRKRP